MQKQLVVLTALSFLHGQLLASGPVDLPAGGPLRIEVVSGNGSVNSLTSPNVVSPLVRVRSQSGALVPGAKVRFELATPKNGFFAGERLAIETETDSRGEATADGYIPRRSGSFKMTVIVSNQSGQTTARIHQRNGVQNYSVVKESGVSNRRWYLVAGAVAAAGAVILAKKSSGAKPTATIVLGTPTAGGR